MQHEDYEIEWDILCPDRVVLDCLCGEKLILLGREEDWYSEGRTTFECHQCGGAVSLSCSPNEGRGPVLAGAPDVGGSYKETESVTDLIRSLRATQH